MVLYVFSVHILSGFFELNHGDWYVHFVLWCPYPLGNPTNTLSVKRLSLCLLVCYYPSITMYTVMHLNPYK